MKEVKVALPGREEAVLTFAVDAAGEITQAKLTGIGGPEFLKDLQRVRATLHGPVKDLPVPEGKSPSAILLRELILKVRGEWDFPYQDEELCHCRVIPTALVDAAIVCGAHTPREVSEQTSASTSCGTCRPDVEAMIQYRLFGGAKLDVVKAGE